MTVRKIKIIVIIFLSVFLLTSCSETKPSTECPDDQVMVDGSCISSDIIELANDINAVYIFDKEDNIVKEDVIDSIEVIVDYVLIRGITEDKEITYNISSDNDNYLDTYNNAVYLNIDHIDSFETVFHTILSLYDTKVNYGLLYGLSNYIAIELNYIEEPLSTDTLNYFLNEDKQDLMDLTYPTFNETYATLYDVENVKTLSIQFVSFIIYENSIYNLIDLLALTEYDEFEQQYNTYLNEWILDSGYDYEIPMNEYPIFFDRNPRNYIAVWYTDHITWNLSKGYKNLFIDKALFGNPLLSDYKTLKDTIIKCEMDMDEADQLLRDESIVYRDLTIRIQGYQDGISWYTGGNIYLEQLNVLNHEYIHYITWPYLESAPWIREVIAYYYDYAYEFYYSDAYHQYMYDYILSEEDYYGLEYMAKLKNTVEFFKEIHGVSPDFSKDKMELNDIFVYLENQYNDIYQVATLDVSSSQVVSFSKYFIESFGEEAFLSVLRDSDKIMEMTNNTWEENFSDWEQYIKEKYEQE